MPTQPHPMPSRPHPTVRLAAALLLLLASGPGWSANSPAPAATIEVTGSGEVFAKPDMAEIQIGAVSEAETASAALAHNNEAMTRLQALMKARGLAPADVQTGEFSVTPNYRSDKGGPRRLVGYRVTHQLRVTVRKLAGLGGLLDAVVNVGANRISGIRFAVSDTAALLDRARRHAMADARHRAEVYAAGAGLRLGSVTHITERTSGGPRPMAMEAGALRAVPLAPGQVTLRSTVNVSFAATPRQ
ncbi:MAG TPA: SIMPL domain-containing protein [Gammaproteobacteria bacterium]|nr:SIMPL domain-containing protein [Gammaproteobacteria bacterium]